MSVRKIKTILTAIIMVLLLSVCSMIFVSAETTSVDYVINGVEGSDAAVSGDVIGLLGDADKDSRINVKDATAIQKNVASLLVFDETQKTLSDVDQNLNVNIKDATAIQKWVAGIAVNMPINHLVYIPTEDTDVTTEPVTKVPTGTVTTTEPVTEVPTETVTTTEPVTEVPTETVITTVPIVTMPVKTAYEIEYYLYDNSEYLQEIGVENPNPDLYYSEDGLKLTNLHMDGFVFEGWYDGAGANAEKVKEIAKGESGIIELYAKWTAVEYKITYINAAVHTNPDTYTIEDRIVLSDPQWSGLAFSNWTDNSSKIQVSDNNGKYQAIIEKGTTGRIELTANWGNRANYAVPETGIRELVSEYNPETGVQYFVYKLGTIHNVVLETLATEKKAYGEEIVWDISKTVSLEDSVAETAAQSISNSVTKTSEWSETKEWTKKHSETLSWDVNLEINGEGKIKKDIFKLGFKLSGGVGKDYTDEYSNLSSVIKGGSDSGSSEESIESSSTVAYNQAVTKEFSTTITIDKAMPAGTYSYVYYTDVEVFAAVMYDPVSGNYKLDTYSVMDDELKAMRLYTPGEDSNINIKSSEGLPCDIPLEELEEFMNNAYYVRYDGNSGSGKMLDAAYSCLDEHELRENQFTKEGYTWIGWELEDGRIVTAGAKVSGLASKGELVTAKAVWSANPYTVTFDPNGGTVGKDEKRVTYDSSYDELPLPVRTGYTFGGWEFNNEIVTADTIVSYADAHTLVAQWTANTYTITINPNGAEGEEQTMTFCYDESQKLRANGYSRPQYTFMGWSTDANATTPTYLDGQLVENMATEGNVTLYAVWVKTVATASYPGNESRMYIPRGGQHADLVTTGMSKEDLLANGYKQVEISVVFDASRNYLIQHNQARLQIVTDVGELSRKDWYTSEFANNGWTRGISFTVSVNIDNLNDDGSFRLVWSTQDTGGSANDAWYLGTTNVTVTAK